MGEMKEAMLQAGLINEEEAVAAEHKDWSQDSDITVVATKARSRMHMLLNNLDNVPTMRAFKLEAKKLLWQCSSPGIMAEIITKAHRFQDESDKKTRRFIAFFLWLRHQLEKNPKDQHHKLIKQAFRRRANRSFSIEIE